VAVVLLSVGWRRHGLLSAPEAAVPTAGRVALPRIGENAFAITLAGARAQAPAALLLSGSRARIALGLCELRVLPIGVDLPATTSALGSAAVPLAVPDDPRLLGVEALLQWVIADPQGAALGLASLGDPLHPIVGR
jgi:hypothetical protein